MDPLLIDERLTPEVAGVAQARGYLALHVTWLDLAGYDDRNVTSVAAKRNFIVVTNNRRDYLRLYAAMEYHNGLIVIVPSVAAADQRQLFGFALDAAEHQDSLINLLIEVHADGTVDVRNWAKDLD